MYQIQRIFLPNKHQIHFKNCHLIMKILNLMNYFLNIRNYRQKMPYLCGKMISCQRIKKRNSNNKPCLILRFYRRLQLDILPLSNRMNHGRMLIDMSQKSLEGKQKKLLELAKLKKLWRFSKMQRVNKLLLKDNRLLRVRKLLLRAKKLLLRFRKLLKDSKLQLPKENKQQPKANKKLLKVSKHLLKANK